MRTHWIKIVFLFAVAAVFFQAAPVFADTLTLKDGQVLKGKFISRDAEGVTFELGGQQLMFKNENIKSLDMDFAGAPAGKKDDGAKKGKVTVPAGTAFIVRTKEVIDSRKQKTGHKFTCTLEADLVVDGVVAAPRGATVYGALAQAKKSGRLAGQSEMTLVFTDIMINNQMKPIKTSMVTAVSERTGKQTVGRTARAAAIGGLIDGSSGAKTGAKVGAGVSLLTRGSQVHIPAGTMLETSFSAPFTP